MNRPPIRLLVWARGPETCDPALKQALDRDAPTGLVCTFVGVHGAADVCAHDALIIDGSLPEATSAALVGLRARAPEPPILLWRPPASDARAERYGLVGTGAQAGAWFEALLARLTGLDICEAWTGASGEWRCSLSLAPPPDLGALTSSCVLLPAPDAPITEGLVELVERLVALTHVPASKTLAEAPAVRPPLARSSGATTVLQRRGESTRRPRILVAGGMELCEHLSHHGVEALAALLPIDAAALARDAPDAMIVELGQAGGVALLTALRDEARLLPLPILARCADDETSSQIRALELGADDAVPASATDDELAVRLAARLARRRALERLVPADTAGLATERRMRDRLEDEVAIAERSLRPFTVSVIAIDNDGLDSAARDDATATLASELRTRIRRSDLLGRSGGELLLLLRECSADATVALLHGVASAFKAAQQERVATTQTFSAGVAAFPDQGRGATALLECARRTRREVRDAGSTSAIRMGDAMRADVVNPKKDVRSQRLIFIADPDEETRRLLRYALERQGFAVEAFDDGAELERRLLESPEPQIPDAVLFELHMPFVHGLELLRALQRHAMRRRPKMLLVTNRASDADVVRAFSLGACDHIQKPFSVPVLVARLTARLREDVP